MNFENVFKSWLSTLIGAVIMCVGFYGWYMDDLSDWQAIGCGLAGFALFGMRENLSSYVGQLFQVLIDKFKSK
jgi:hypothetical protein